MGPLQERLSNDMKTALKAGDKDRLQVLRMLVNALKQEQLGLGRDALGEAEEVAVLHKAVKARRDAVVEATRLGRQDVVARETFEIEVAQTYLPTMLTGEALLQQVRQLATEIGWAGAKDTGRFMKEWMARHPGRADGRDVQTALRSLSP